MLKPLCGVSFGFGIFCFLFSLIFTITSLVILISFNSLSNAALKTKSTQDYNRVYVPESAARTPFFDNTTVSGRANNNTFVQLPNIAQTITASALNDVPTIKTKFKGKSFITLYTSQLFSTSPEIQVQFTSSRNNVTLASKTFKIPVFIVVNFRYSRSFCEQTNSGKYVVEGQIATCKLLFALTSACTLIDIKSGKFVKTTSFIPGSTRVEKKPVAGDPAYLSYDSAHHGCRRQTSSALPYVGYNPVGRYSQISYKRFVDDGVPFSYIGSLVVPDRYNAALYYTEVSPTLTVASIVGLLLSIFGQAVSTTLTVIFLVCLGISLAYFTCTAISLVVLIIAIVTGGKN